MYEKQIWLWKCLKLSRSRPGPRPGPRPRPYLVCSFDFGFWRCGGSVQFVVFCLRSCVLCSDRCWFPVLFCICLLYFLSVSVVPPCQWCHLCLVCQSAPCRPSWSHLCLVTSLVFQVSVPLRQNLLCKPVLGEWSLWPGRVSQCSISVFLRVCVFLWFKTNSYFIDSSVFRLHSSVPSHHSTGTPNLDKNCVF